MDIPGFKERVESIVKGKDAFEDARGMILNYELPESVNLVGLITSKKGALRANHYHPIQEQKALLISGSYVSVSRDLLVEGSPVRDQRVVAGDCVITPPMVAHTMIFLEDSVFLNLVNGNRDHNKFAEHTKKYDLVKPEDIEAYLRKYGVQQQ